MQCVLPQNSFELSQEVMQSISGGDATRFFKNVTGLMTAMPLVKRALSAIGFNTTKFNAVLAMGYATAVAKFGTAAVVSAGIVGGVLAVAGFYALWNYRMFY